MSVTPADRKIVRTLAERLAEIAAQPEQQQKINEWRRHNSMMPGKPMVLQAPEGVWDEFVPQSALKCSSELARSVEHHLRTKLYKTDHLRDDEPITKTFNVRLHINETGWTKADVTAPEQKGVWGAVRYNTVLTPESNLEEILPMRKLTCDREASDNHYQQVCELVGDILDVRQVGRLHFGTCPTDAFATIRGIETFMMDMVERPEWLHKVFARMLKIDLDLLRQAEEQNLFTLNNGVNYVASGGIGVTDELPQKDFDGVHVRTRDLWGFAAAQIFSEVSPAMHEEFALRYEIQYLDKFGLNAYGCCEPLHLKVGILKKIPRLRRVSMSPWINPVKAAEEVGDKFIYSYKPNPAYLATAKWEIDVCRQEMLAVLEAAKRNGCITEFIMKDTHTCCGQPERYDQWTDMAMELAKQYA